jgi:hypothetical protein
MQVGDLVKVRRLKGAGLIQSVQTSREPSGPDGDFFITRHYRVLLNGKIWRIHEDSIEIIRRNDDE